MWKFSQQINSRTHLILAVVLTWAVPRCAFCAGHDIQAPLSTSTFRVIGIIFTETNGHIIILQLLWSESRKQYFSMSFPWQLITSSNKHSAKIQKLLHYIYPSFKTSSACLRSYISLKIRIGKMKL